LPELLRELGKREINEVQVEAGPVLCGALLQQGLIDEILIYQAPILLGGGAESPFAAPRLDNMDDRVHLQWIETRRIGKDMRLRLKPVYQES
jgi:diaminohydroxyphosphoribosylaminopyrimidine deaminase/5-amino-6-(5-phosphoribosylamino)uracil reductase